MSSSIGKRRREQQKREKAQEKAERKAARLTNGDDLLAPDEGDGQPRSETQLIEELGVLQETFGADQISLEDFEERRGRIQAELQRLSQ